jgi:hypothetical protein
MTERLLLADPSTGRISTACNRRLQHSASVISPNIITMLLYRREGRVITQAVSRLLPTAAARVRSQLKSCEIYGGQGGAGVGFLRVLWFPLPILIPPTPPHPSSIVRGWYNRLISGRRAKWTQSHPTSRILKRKHCCIEIQLLFNRYQNSVTW